MTSIARRYAKALLLQTGSNLEDAKANRAALLALADLFNAGEAGRMLKNPVMPKSLKKEVLDYGMGELGVSSAVKQTVDTLVDVGRAELLPAVASAYAAYIDDAEGKVHAVVQSAVPLPADDEQAIAAAMGQLLHKQVDVTASVNPTLLGGFTVRVGNYLVDLSLKTRLEGLATSAVAGTIR